MRILIIEPDPSHGGGMEAVSLRLAKELSRRGHSIFLAYARQGSMLSTYNSITEKSFKLDLVGFARRKPFRLFKQLLALRRVIREEKIDVIFSSHLGYIPVAATLKILTHVPAFFHLGLPADHVGWIAHLALRQMGGGISPAQHTLDTWAAAGWPNTRLWLVPNWVDLDEFAPLMDVQTVRNSLGWPLASFCVGYVGRIVPEKGLETLVIAFNKFSRENHRARLILIGNGSEAFKDRLCNLVSNKDRLSILSATSEAGKVLGALDVATVPSVVVESFPLGAVEAMATGTPVICSHVGALPLILGEAFADLLFDPGNAEQLYARLVSVANDWTPKRGVALREHAISTFGHDEAVSAYETILQGAGCRQGGTK